MSSNRAPFIAGTGAVIMMGGILGGVNFHWSRQPEFPLYGYIIDICAIPVLIYTILYVKRLKAASTDEFAVTKKRFAAQTGFVFGFAMFAISGIIPLLFPQTYHQFLGTLDGVQEGFIMGRVLGMAPFVVGLLFGHVTAWLKYR